MDVSAISTRLKTAAAVANPAAGVDSADPATAFSAMLNLVGSKFTAGFNTGYALGNLEMKLMSTPEQTAQAASDSQDDSNDSTDQASATKSTKSDNTKTKD